MRKHYDRQMVTFMLGVMFGSTLFWLLMKVEELVPATFYLMIPLAVYGVVVMYRVLRGAWAMMTNDDDGDWTYDNQGER